MNKAHSIMNAMHFRHYCHSTVCWWQIFEIHGRLSLYQKYYACRSSGENLNKKKIEMTIRTLLHVLKETEKNIQHSLQYILSMHLHLNFFNATLHFLLENRTKFCMQYTYFKQ